MLKNLSLSILLAFTINAGAQSILMRGNVRDSSSGALTNAILMALRFKDSSLVEYSRSDKSGIFKTISVPRDTYLIVISHPSFSDRTFFMLPGEQDTAYNFRNILLPPKSVQLKEVEILAYRDMMYYKGDTLMFTADSFKTGANATVEDLLRQLPGFQVDNEGKIKVKGKKVDQVLVDGDEFFGSDPTVATRNLNATTIENVQVYEKKNESTDEGAAETLQVLNLQMKDDAKKGYFGKVSGASDFRQFYENQLLLNYFKKKRKISAFGLAANTPREGFMGSDIWKYGLQGEERYSYDPETDSWTSNNNTNTGKPRTIKSGFYFNDSYGKNLKVNGNYSYNQSQLLTATEENVQNFLPDTAFSTRRVGHDNKRNDGHRLNIVITQKLDSLTELIIAPKYSRSTTSASSLQKDAFFSQDGIETRATQIDRKSDILSVDASLQVKLKRSFMKKDRSLMLQYFPTFSNSENNSLLNTSYEYFSPAIPTSSLSQKRSNTSEKNNQDFILQFIEPITKKIKSEITLNYSENVLGTNRSTFDYNGAAYDFLNTSQSNSFQNKRTTAKGFVKFTYDVRKYRFSIGSTIRNINQENYNRSTGTRLQQSQLIPLPMASFNYKFAENSNFQISYRTSSQLPDLQQMQPVVDNSNPNNLSVGTPSLLPTFENNISANYYFYKAISDASMWSSLSYNDQRNQFSSYTTYDSLGRSLTQQVNVNGNYNAGFYVGGHCQVFKKFLQFEGSVGANTSQFSNYVNGNLNRTVNTSINTDLGFSKYKEKISGRISGGYNYNIPSSSISSKASQPYYFWSLNGSFSIKMRKGFFISTDGNYNNNGNRAPGYNLNYFIWNASAGKSFLKTENLTVSANAFDILNQNISNQRNVSSNQIIDNKTSIIKRYFLLKVQLKFNNQKTKVEENEWD